MNKESKPAHGRDWLVLVLICIGAPLFVYWMDEHHPAVYIWILVGVFSIVFLWALLVTLEFVGKVLRDIFSLFDR